MRIYAISRGSERALTDANGGAERGGGFARLASCGARDVDKTSPPPPPPLAARCKKENERKARNARGDRKKQRTKKKIDLSPRPSSGRYFSGHRQTDSPFLRRRAYKIRQSSRSAAQAVGRAPVTSMASSGKNPGSTRTTRRAGRRMRRKEEGGGWKLIKIDDSFLSVFGQKKARLRSPAAL
ncbi:hypothetical protein V9T40_007511 [Parthenolecanium corni]|uniref:Uncharacterized protein n=1 Tax=Parthenolecanium corni TaxID=536013 RepID=A0AAN9TJJ8_9HEMI